MGCDYHYMFLKKDLDDGKIVVQGDYTPSTFDFCCKLFIEHRFDFIFPYMYDSNLNENIKYIHERNLKYYIKYVYDYEYVQTFEKDFKSEDLFSENPEKYWYLDKKYFTMPMSVKSLVEQIFPLQVEFVYQYNVLKNEDKANETKEKAEGIVSEIVKKCKELLINNGLDKNEFCHIYYPYDNASYTEKADKNTFLGYAVTC